MQWDAGFHARDARFAPLTAAAAFADCADWPRVAEWGARLADAGCVLPVSFVAQAASRRAAPRQRDYDAAIADDGVVPSRERSWHDFLNMLVWARFQRSKLALHRRQRRLAAEPRPPGTRGKEGDALAMLDEGSVLVAGGRRVVFGHALYEHLVLRPQARAAAMLVPLDDGDDLDAALLALLAQEGSFTAPRQLPRTLL